MVCLVYLKCYLPEAVIYASLVSMSVCPLHALSRIAANSLFTDLLSALKPNWWDISSASPTVSFSCELLHHWLVLSLARRSSPICSLHLPWRNPRAWGLFCNGRIGMLGFGTFLITVEPLLMVTAPRLNGYISSSPQILFPLIWIRLSAMATCLCSFRHLTHLEVVSQADFLWASSSVPPHKRTNDEAWRTSAWEANLDSVFVVWETPRNFTTFIWSNRWFNHSVWVKYNLSNCFAIS